LHSDSSVYSLIIITIICYQSILTSTLQYYHHIYSFDVKFHFVTDSSFKTKNEQ